MHNRRGLHRGMHFIRRDYKHCQFVMEIFTQASSFVRMQTKPGEGVVRCPHSPTVPGSHEGLFYRARVMTGWYTEPCLIRNPSETRIMSSYLHDCQGTVKKSARGCGAMTSCCPDPRASRQLLSNPCCGLAPGALVNLVDGTSGAQLQVISLFLYFLFVLRGFVQSWDARQSFCSSLEAAQLGSD